MSLIDENAQESDIPDNDDEKFQSYDEGETNGVDPNISDSKTVILKAITHRGTQTVIQCDPNVTKEDFIDMIIKTRL